MSQEQQMTSLRKKRGVVRASVTRQATRLTELELQTREPTTLDLAKQMSQKLISLDAEFRNQHYSLIDMIDDEDTLAGEQEVLDKHDDTIAELTARVERLKIVCSS